MNNETQHTLLLPWSKAKQKGTKGHCHAAQIFDVTGKAIIMIEPTVNEDVANQLLDLISSAPSLLKENQELKAELVNKNWLVNALTTAEKTLDYRQGIIEELIKALEVIELKLRLEGPLHETFRTSLREIQQLLIKTKPQTTPSN